MLKFAGALHFVNEIDVVVRLHCKLPSRAIQAGDLARFGIIEQTECITANASGRRFYKIGD